MNSARQSIRYKVTKPREAHFCIITFKDLAWKDYRTTVVDISRHGAGIESDTKLDPGFIWFLDRLGGNRGGVLMWSRTNGEKYRAGIRFISLSYSEEQFISEQVNLIRANKELTSPEAVIATIMNALTCVSSAPEAPKETSGEKPDGDNPLHDIRDMMSKL